MGVEDEETIVFFDEVGQGAGQGSADLEFGAAGEDGAVVTDARHPLAIVDSDGCGGVRDGAWRFNGRGRFPRLLRGDSSGQRLARALRVVDHIERVDLVLQLLEGLREGLLVEVSEQGLVEAFVLALRGRFIRFPRDWFRADLIVIDDIGLLAVGTDAAEGLYRLVDAAYEKRSIAVSSNLHPAGFDELMPKTLATATVDRLLHHAHVCQTSGESIRLTQALAGKGVAPMT